MLPAELSTRETASLHSHQGTRLFFFQIKIFIESLRISHHASQLYSLPSPSMSPTPVIPQIRVKIKMRKKEEKASKTKNPNKQMKKKKTKKASQILSADATQYLVSLENAFVFPPVLEVNGFICRYKTRPIR